MKVEFGVSSSVYQIGEEELESELSMTKCRDLVKYFLSLLNQKRMHLTSVPRMAGLINFLVCSPPPSRYRYLSGN